MLVVRLALLFVTLALGVVVFGGLVRALLDKVADRYDGA